MPRLEVPVFLVLMDPADPAGEQTTHEVQVRGGDQLRAELEAKKQGVTLKEAMHTTYLWAWAAMERTGQHTGGFRAFMDRCVLVESAKDGDGEAQLEPVDPTRPDPSGD